MATILPKGGIVPYLLLLTIVLFTGCSTKICGIDEKIFHNFSLSQQESICKAYAKAAGKARLLEQKRLLLAEENRKKKLELELKKVQCLYQPRPDDPYASTQVLDSRIVSGQILDGKRRYPIIPLEVEIARGEVRKICFDHYCFWITYQGGELLINVEPDWNKRDFGRYVGKEGEYYLTKRTKRLLPNDWFRGEYRDVAFQKDGVVYKLRFFIRYR